MPRWSTALLLAPGLALASPSVSFAAAPPEEEEAGGDEDPAVEEAKSLFTEGAGKFETADYTGAIELWTKAYSIVPNKPEYAHIKARLIANLASAQERAYAVDDELAHLNQAKILLESYSDVIEDIYTSTIEREKERAWVEDRLEKIQQELDEAEARAAAAAAETKGGSDEPRLPPGKGLVIGGSVLTGLGVAGLGVMVGGVVMGLGANDVSDLKTNDYTAREERFNRGRTGNALAIAGGAGAAVLVGTGVALLVVGLGKKKKAGEPEDQAQARFVPVLAPGFAGATLGGRF